MCRASSTLNGYAFSTVCFTMLRKELLSVVPSSSYSTHGDSNKNWTTPNCRYSVSSIWDLHHVRKFAICYRLDFLEGSVFTTVGVEPRLAGSPVPDDSLMWRLAFPSSHLFTIEANFIADRDSLYDSAVGLKFTIFKNKINFLSHKVVSLP